MSFQPPDPPEPDYDTMAEEMFERYEKSGYAVISRDEWTKKLDDAANDGYAEGRKDELEQIAKDLLPGTYYMDPPDGGSVSLMEQLERMAKDAARYRWLRQSGSSAIDKRREDMVKLYGDTYLDAAIDREIEA